MAYRSFPLSINPALATDYEVPILAANGIPSGVGTVHVTFAPQDGSEVSKVRRGPKKIMIKGRFTGTDLLNSDWLCRWWEYDPDTSQWHSTAEFYLVGASKISTTKGQMVVLEHDPNARYGYLEVVSGVAADQDLEFTVVAQEW